MWKTWLLVLLTHLNRTNPTLNRTGMNWMRFSLICILKALGLITEKPPKQRHPRGSWIFLAARATFRRCEGIEPTDRLYTDVLDDKYGRFAWKSCAPELFLLYLQHV